MRLSIVIPVYNSAATLEKVVDDCFVALNAIDFEIVLVNDGSSDKSEEIVFQLAKKYDNIKAVSLAKNAGEFNAVICGLNFADGEYTAIIDDDGQNPPSEILKLLAEAEKGYDVVYAKYEQKMHNKVRNLGSLINDFFAWIFIGKPFNLYLSSFKIIHRKLKERIIERQHTATYPDGLIFYFSPKYSSVVVVHKLSLIESRYTHNKLTGTFFSMLQSGKNKWVIIPMVLLSAPVFFFFAIANIMSDQAIDKFHSMLFSLFVILGFGAIFMFLLLLASLVYDKAKIMQRKKLLKEAKKSFKC